MNVPVGLDAIGGDDDYPEDPRPKRKTPYTSVGVHPKIRDELADIRDNNDEFETYGDVLCTLIQNAQEDPL